MKVGLVLISLFSTLFAFVNRVSEMNALKEAAENAYLSGNYPQAIKSYQILLEEYNATEDEIIINLANVNYLAGNSEKAIENYSSLVNHQKKEIRSLASNQLGIISYLEGNTEKASNSFKNAIIADPFNLKAVYNYELLNKSDGDINSFKKESRQGVPEKGNGNQKVKQEKKSESKSSDKAGGERQGSDQGDLAGEEVSGSKDKGDDKALQYSKDNSADKDKKSDKRGDQSKEDLISNRIRNQGMSPERAFQILESMNTEEQIYLQQLKRKSLNNDKDIPPY